MPIPVDGRAEIYIGEVRRDHGKRLHASTRDLDPGAALGRAFAGRFSDIGRLSAQAMTAAGWSEITSLRLAKGIRHAHNVATLGIARFLIMGQPSTAKESRFIYRLGAMAALNGLSAATLRGSALVWRDTNLEVLNEEIERVRTTPDLADLARATIQASADTSIVRLITAYDHQMGVIRRRETTVMNDQWATALGEAFGTPSWGSGSVTALRVDSPRTRGRDKTLASWSFFK